MAPTAALLQEKFKTAFEVFLSDVELRPAPNLSLDRIDNNRGYETSNMRWTTKSVQQKSRRPSFEWRRAA